MIKPKVHFIGIGGIGTSALARWFLTNGYKVSGSDVFSSEITSELKKQGIKVFLGHKAKNVPTGANLAIFSVAVPPDNPERQKAKELGIITRSYAEALGDLSQKYKTLAVAGAHGKSTTTALLSLVLIKAGFDPIVIIGTRLKEFKNSNFRKGRSNYLIIEADEYQGSFLNYSPTAAIITNIDREHLDYYENLKNIKNAFLKFIKNIQPGGVLIVNKDDKNLFNLKDKIEKIVKKKNIKIIWYSITNFGRSSAICYKIRKTLKIFGEHNVSNALGVYSLAKALGIKDKDIFRAISSYRGAWRRMEYRGNLKSQIGPSGESPATANLKIKVYDDYAHHPTEIKATLAGIVQKWPKTPVICVFQPHQAKRLSLLFKDFVGAFDAANALVLLPVYQVSGRDKVSQNVDSKKLAEAIQKRINSKLEIRNWKLRKAIYLPYPKKLFQVIHKIIRRHSEYSDEFVVSDRAIIVMMGAGDIYKITNKLIQ